MRGYRSSVRDERPTFSVGAPLYRAARGLAPAFRLRNGDKGFAPRYRRATFLHRSQKMRVGVPKEIKVHEYRVGLVPASVAELTAAGHEVIVETKAGTGIDFSDQDYINVGVTIAADAAEVFARSDMIVKVKEPQAQAVALLEPR